MTSVHYVPYLILLVDGSNLMRDVSVVQGALTQLLMRDDIELSGYERHGALLALKMLGKELSEHADFIQEKLLSYGQGDEHQ